MSDPDPALPVAFEKLRWFSLSGDNMLSADFQRDKFPSQRTKFILDNGP